MRFLQTDTTGAIRDGQETKEGNPGERQPAIDRVQSSETAIVSVGHTWLKNWTSGFRCDARADEKTGVSFVEVRYLVDGYYDPAPADAKRARLERYLPALQEHFQCAVSDAGGCLVLTVRERQAT